MNSNSSIIGSGFSPKYIDPAGLELEEKVVDIRRVAKVTKGGKRFHFTAMTVVGNGNGIVGYGLGKSNEVPGAIKKGTDKARKSLIKIPLRGSTIPHEVTCESSSSRVVLLPAAPGTGVISGGAVRAVADLAGIHDILSKVVGSRNPINVVAAVMKALSMLSLPEDIAAERDRQVSDLDLPPYYRV
ncbi:MAG: 30S ribosomal protein S5 [Thermodesulfobacteriota bacterium]